MLFYEFLEEDISFNMNDYFHLCFTLHNLTPCYLSEGGDESKKDDIINLCMNQPDYATISHKSMERNSRNYSFP